MYIRRLLIFLITVTAIYIPNNSIDAQSSDPTPIEFGDTMTSTLESDEELWSFDARAGQIISIDVRSSVFDPRVELRTESGLTIREDDDSGRRLNALIKNWEIAEGGSYIIAVQSFNSTANGLYSVSLLADTDSNQNANETSSTNTIDIGQSLDGQLLNSQDEWTFDAEVDDSVTIDLSSTDFDAYLVLQDPNGRALEENDDDGPGLDARITNYNISVSGTYIIVIRSFDGDASGAYSLSLSQGDGSNIQEPEFGGGRTEIGATIEESLLAGDYALWTFEATAGDVITISVGSEDFDTYLQLFAGENDFSEENYLLYDDDSGGSQDLLISGYAIETTGIYTVVVSSYSSLGSGDYVLSILNQDDVVSDNRNFYTIRIGATETGTLDNGEDVWSFLVDTGDIISIELTSDDFDTFLDLRDPRGASIASDDDSGAGRDSFIEEYEISQGGLYTVIVRGFEGNATGNYTLTITRQISDDDPPNTANDDTIQISIGDTITAELGQSRVGWILEVDRSTRMIIHVTSDDFDTVLEILDGNGDVIHSDDDSGQGTDSLLENIELEAGTYIIVVSSFSNSATGEYTLSVKQVLPQNAKWR